MTEAPSETVAFDPFEPGFIEDPHPTYRRLRDVAPVYQTPYDVWILGRYEHVSEFLRGDHSAEARNATGGQSRPSNSKVWAVWGWEWVGPEWASVSVMAASVGAVLALAAAASASPSDQPSREVTAPYRPDGDYLRHSRTVGSQT